MKKQVLLFLLIFIGCSPNIETVQNLYAQSDSVRIVQHLTTITKTDGYRNHLDTALLNQTAEYIFSIFSQYADTTYYQSFELNDKIYKNVVCRLGSENNKPIVVVGAHYDVAGATEGADDNASGVVGLLELVRMLSEEKLRYPIEIVAYTLEEQWPMRGSLTHAKSLRESNIPVYGMVAFEMIGYFDDRANSQRYPNKALRYIYGNKGDYILLANKIGTKKFSKKFSSGFKKYGTIKTKSIEAPIKWGVNRSDHQNYWKFGYDALMITNTANFRNPNYHKSSDKMETLDIPKMMKVIDATALAIINLKD